MFKSRASKPFNPLAQQNGFSLVEIMIVLGIIGTIIALIGQQIVGANDRSRVRQARIVLTQVSDALNNYNMDCNKYPESLDALIKADDCSGWTGPYMKGKGGRILDPWNNPLEYSPSENGDFTLKSYGKDGKPGGTESNKDIPLHEESGEG